MRSLLAITSLLLVLSLPSVGLAGTKRPPVVNPCVQNPCVGGTGTQPVIPEPSSLILFGLGAAVVGGAIWRRSRK